MGREWREITVRGRVSRHNSRQDNIDDRAFNDLCARVRALVAEAEQTPEGASISLMVEGGDDQDWDYPDWGDDEDESTEQDHPREEGSP